MTEARQDDVVDDLLSQHRVSRRLVDELKRRNALPTWISQSAKLGGDWLAELHRNVTRDGWPAVLGATGAGLVDDTASLASVDFEEAAAAISMPMCTPGYLRSLLNILAVPVVPPKDGNDDSYMLLDEALMGSASSHLSALIGLLQYTGYCDAPAAHDAFGGAVTIGTRFLYYHELAHVLRRLTADNSKPDWTSEFDQHLAEELIVDQVAFAALATELRNATVLREIAMSGVALAIGFVAAREFANTERPDGIRSTKHATLRMHHLFRWASLSLKMGGGLQPGAGTLVWDVLTGLLKRIEQIPSPVFSLLRATADRPQSDWTVASNHFIRWCAFGDPRATANALQSIRASAQAQQSSEPRATRVLGVIEFILNDTAKLEPDLGLAERIG